MRKHLEFTTTSLSTTVGFQIAVLLLYDMKAQGVDNCAFRGECTIIGREPSTEKTVNVKARIIFANIAGTLSAFSFHEDKIGDPSLTGVASAYGVVSNKLQVGIAGVTGKTLVWSAWLDIWTGEM